MRCWTAVGGGGGGGFPAPVAPGTPFGTPFSPVSTPPGTPSGAPDVISGGNSSSRIMLTVRGIAVGVVTWPPWRIRETSLLGFAGAAGGRGAAGGGGPTTSICCRVDLGSTSVNISGISTKTNTIPAWKRAATPTVQLL